MSWQLKLQLLTPLSRNRLKDAVNRNPPQTHQLGNISYTLTISLTEAATGKTASLIIPRNDACEICSGTGQSWRNDDGTCSNCENKGLIKDEKRLAVRIPAGVESGSRLRIAGEGNLEAAQVARGDLYIEISVDRHELFERKGKDLHSFFKVTEDELKGGSEIIVPTLLDGQKRLRIPSDTNVGATFRLAGLGLPSMEGGERGDLFVKVGKQAIKHDSDNTRDPSVGMPSSPSSAQREKVKMFFLKHAKALSIAAVVLLLVGSIIYFSNRQSGEGISPPSNSENISPPQVTKSKPFYSPDSIPTATPAIHLPFSLPNGANITPPQGPRGAATIIIVNRADGDIALKVVSSSSQKTRRFVYVRSGKTVVISKLTREAYLLRWETGSDWDLNSRRFASMRSIHQFDQTFDLRRTNWKVNFTPSAKGKLQEVSLHESDFEDK